MERYGAGSVFAEALVAGNGTDVRHVRESRKVGRKSGKGSRGLVGQVWDYVKARKWNRRRKEGTGKTSNFYDAQGEYDAAMFGSRESAESWRSDVSKGARGRSGGLDG